MVLQLSALPLFIARSVLGNPRCALSVVLKARGVFERIFGGVERQVSFVILLGGFNCVEAHSHIFLASTEETAHAHHCRFNLTALVDQKIHDLAELLIVLVVNILLIPVSHSSAVRRNAGHQPSLASLLLCKGGSAGDQYASGC